MTAANIITVAVPVLAFAAGIFFAKWMGDRKRARRRPDAWYREIGR